MAIYINMPRLGLTMTEGIITKWVKQEGDKVEKGEVLAEIESDKSVVPYEAPQSGILLKIIVGDMDAVPVYEPIAIIGDEGESVDDMLPAANCIETSTKNLGGSEENITEEPSVIKEAHINSDRVFASPAAKREAKENKLDIDDIPFPAGKKRIERQDVIAFIDAQGAKATPLAKKIATEYEIDLMTALAENGKRIYSSDIEIKKTLAPLQSENKFIPVAGMRKVIASRMKESLQTAAHLTTVMDVDMTNAVALHKSVMSEIQEKYEVKVSMNDIIIKCVAKALSDYPRVNCEFTEKEIILKSDVNIGMAVAVDEGLVVPVIKNVPYLTLGQLAAESKRLAAKAKDGRLLPDDMSGSTFTVSNLGMYGVSSFTSIINQPESAILSVGMIDKKPVAVNDEIVIRPIMTLTLSYDHRPIDGSMSAIFLKKVKENLEQPYKLIV